MKKAVVLWTGGKDSALALFESQDSFLIDRLVTFTPESQRRFYAHPLPLIQAQAKSIGLPHHCISIKKPYNSSYTDAIKALKDDGIDILITGDISRVDGNPNWIKERAEGILDVHVPLWEANRKELLDRLIINGFEVLCTLAYDKYFTPTIAGNHLDTTLYEKLSQLNKTGNIDICGENGEYHTCVLYAPFFQTRIQLINPCIKKREDFHYLDFDYAE